MMKHTVPKAQGVQVRLELHYRRTTWKPFDMHDDALLDLGPHLIDLARWLTESEVRSARTLSLMEQHAEFELEADPRASRSGLLDQPSLP